MLINLLYIFTLLKLLIPILSQVQTETLCQTGKKGVAVTSFQKNLYLLSSSFSYKIINQNYQNIISNNNNNPQNIAKLSDNFEMLEASINTNTNQSVLLIAGYNSEKNKINLYSLNISAPINDKNPNLIHSNNIWISNSRISLINTGIDKYLLSYIVNETKFESLWFKYTYYEGLKILRSPFIIETIDEKINTGMSCFLLYEQFPICFYSTKKTVSSSDEYHLYLIVFDIVFTNYYLYNRGTQNKIQLGTNFGKIEFTKAVSLSNNYAIFCFIENSHLNCLIRELELDFESLTLSYVGGSNINDAIDNCEININQIDILKIGNNKCIIGCVDKTNRKPKFLKVELDGNSLIISLITFDINANIHTTLTLFIHEVNYNQNYYGFIFDNDNSNKLEYTYINLPYCTKKREDIFQMNFDEDTKFKFYDWLEIKTSTISTISDYKIISFSAEDGDKNLFNYEIKKVSDNSKLVIGNTISQNDEIIIKPLSNNVYHSGKFYIEVAPIMDGISGKSCIFDFKAECYEGCSTCKERDQDATSTEKHHCISCKSSYYSLGDLCLKQCTEIQGYQNVDLSKTCKVHELEVSNDCLYRLWYINPSIDNKNCTEESICPENKPYVYSISGECIEKCRYSEFRDGECFISNINGGGENLIELIDNEITNVGDYIFNYLDEDKINKSIVMYGHNITIEITDTNRLQNAINHKLDVSNILNISVCEQILREENSIPDRYELIILKVDLRRNDTASTQVEYQIYNPSTTPPEKLVIDSCENILFQSPLWVDDEYKKKIKELYLKNFDIFDINQKFYSDLCYPYHAEDFDADLTLQKRQEVYYLFNANLCEKSCTFIDLDLNTYQAICDCTIKKDGIKLGMSRVDLFEFIEKEDQKIVHEEKISNIKSMKCFKYVFSSDGFLGNWGSYFMMLMILGFIIVGIIWYNKGQDAILYKIRNNLDFILLRLADLRDEKFRQKFEELKRKFKENDLGDEQIIPDIDNNKNENIQNEIDVDENNNIIQKEKINTNKDEIIINKDKNKANEIEYIKKKGPKKNIFLTRSILLNKDQKPEDIIIKEKEEEDNLTDIEKDLLPYGKAKLLDKRTYCGYYWSFLKLRQLIIFTFISFDDFNLFLIKLLSIFLLLSFNLVYNAIFFFDKIINEIYDDRGKYNIKLEFLNIFISSVLFSFTIISIRFIITCHKMFIKLKNMEEYQDAQKQSFYIHKCLIIKYTIYFIVSLILLIFFWYFITSFGAIFHYTQNHLFLNAFISFCLSNIYPFIYLLIPALFRYLALKKNHEKFYCLSQSI